MGRFTPTRVGTVLYFGLFGDFKPIPPYLGGGLS